MYIVQCSYIMENEQNFPRNSLPTDVIRERIDFVNELISLTNWFRYQIIVRFFSFVNENENYRYESWVFRFVNCRLAELSFGKVINEMR